MIGISCAILVLLFTFQRLGTSKLGHCFAPVILLWFFANFCIGIYNIVKWRPGELTPQLDPQPACPETVPSCCNVKGTSLSGLEQTCQHSTTAPSADSEFLQVPGICWICPPKSVSRHLRALCRAAIFAALSPHYMFVYWRDTHQHGWELMSGVLLCITGVEAMYADLGHFSRRAVQVRFILARAVLADRCIS